MDLNRSNDCLENYEIGRIIKTLLVPSLYVGPTRLEAAMWEGLKSGGAQFASSRLPLVEIGLTDLPKSGYGGKCAPPLPTSLLEAVS